MFQHKRDAKGRETRLGWYGRIAVLFAVSAVQCNTFDDPPERGGAFVPSPALNPVPVFSPEPGSTTAPPVVTQLPPRPTTIVPTSVTTAAPTTSIVATSAASSSGETADAVTSAEAAASTSERPAATTSESDVSFRDAGARDSSVGDAGGQNVESSTTEMHSAEPDHEQSGAVVDAASSAQ